MERGITQAADDLRWKLAPRWTRDAVVLAATLLRPTRLAECLKNPLANRGWILIYTHSQHPPEIRLVFGSVGEQVIEQASNGTVRGASRLSLEAR